MAVTGHQVVEAGAHPLDHAGDLIVDDHLPEVERHERILQGAHYDEIDTRQRTKKRRHAFLETCLGIGDLGVRQAQITPSGHIVEPRHLADRGIHHADLDGARRIGTVAHVREDGKEVVDLRRAGPRHLGKHGSGQPRGVH